MLLLLCKTLHLLLGFLLLDLLLLDQLSLRLWRGSDLLLILLLSFLGAGFCRIFLVICTLLGASWLSVFLLLAFVAVVRLGNLSLGCSDLNLLWHRRLAYIYSNPHLRLLLVGSLVFFFAPLLIPTWILTILASNIEAIYLWLAIASSLIRASSTNSNKPCLTNLLLLFGLATPTTFDCTAAPRQLHHLLLVRIGTRRALLLTGWAGWDLYHTWRIGFL